MHRTKFCCGGSSSSLWRFEAAGVKPNQASIQPKSASAFNRLGQYVSEGLVNAAHISVAKDRGLGSRIHQKNPDRKLFETKI